MSDLQIVRLMWFLSSLTGFVFFGFLSLQAIMDLSYRREGGGVRSAILLAWRTLVFDAILCTCFLIDFAVGVASYIGPLPLLTLGGLILSNILRLCLGIYLLWIRAQIKRIGAIESKVEYEFLNAVRKRSAERALRESEDTHPLDDMH